MKKVDICIILGQITLFFVLSLGSFADETVQVTFALRLAETPYFISALLSAGLLGSVLSGFFTPKILHAYSCSNVILSILVMQALLILVACIVNNFLIFMIVAMLLGCTGSIFWSAILVLVPGLSKTEKQLDRINQLIQSVRNMGYVGGPLFAGFLYAKSSIWGLVVIAMMLVVASFLSYFCFNFLIEKPQEQEFNDGGPKSLDLKGLLQIKGMLPALSPLIITIILSSSLNVLMIIRIKD